MTIYIKKSRKIANYILCIIFALFAVLQLNDPDPILWFIIYGSVAFTFIYANFKKIPRTVIWCFIICLLIYAGIHFSYFMDWIKIEEKNEIFEEMDNEKPYLEGTREFLGLLIAAISLLYHLKK